MSLSNRRKPDPALNRRPETKGSLKTGLKPDRDRSWGAVVFCSPAASDGSCNRLYLLVKLASGKHWDSPKGHPEAGETPLETARREILEESSAMVRFLDGFLKEESWILPDGRPKDTGYFLAEKIGEAPTGGPQGEILDVAWLPFDEAVKRVTYPSGRRVLEAAEAFLENAGG